MKTKSKLMIVALCILLFTLVSIADDVTVIEVTEGDLVNLKISAQDADEDVLTYLYDKPLNSSGQWQTAYGDYGEWEVSVVVSDGEFEVIKPILIRVLKANWPPVLEELDDLVVDEGELVTIIPKATDEEKGDLTFIISEPVGNDGIWETTFEDSGDYVVTVSVTDGEHEVYQEVLIVVEDVNRDPEVDYLPGEEDVEVDEGDELEFSLDVEDPDKDTLAYIWELDEVEVSTSDSIVYTPDFESAGDHHLKATVSDGSVIMGVSWNIEVIDVNRPPVLEKVEDIIVNEGEIVLVDFTAVDPDGDDIRYSISDPIGDDKKWETEFEDAGAYEIELVVSDGTDDISQTFDVIVKDVDRAPEFTEIAELTATELETIEFELKAEDPDGDKITFSAENLPPGAVLEDSKFTLDTNYETVFKSRTWYTSVLKFLRLDNLFYGNKRTYVVKFTAYGKEKFTEQFVKININDLNRAPVLLDMEDIYVSEGDTVEMVPKAIEYDNDRVKFSISEPVGNNGKWKTGFFDAGEYPLTITASDGKESDTKEIKLTIQNTNRAPVIEAIKAVEVNENEPVTITPVAADPDSDSIELSLDAMPAGASLVDNVFTWTPNYDVVDWRNGIGNYKLVFTASDGELTATQETVVSVKDVNRAPVILNATPGSTIKVQKGLPVIFKVNATDPDGDDLTYTWKFGWFDKLEATHGIKRTFKTPGTKKIKVIVSDGEFRTVRTWKVKVIEKSEQPKKPEEQVIQYEGKTYKLVIYSGENLTSNEKLVEKDNVQYKLAIV